MWIQETEPRRWQSSTAWLVAAVMALGGAVGAQTTVWFDDFELGWGNWNADNGVWSVGAPSSGPAGSWSGMNVAGTNLLGNHPGDTDSRLISGSILLPAVNTVIGEELHLQFMQWFSYSSCDSGQVQVQVFDLATSTWGPWLSKGTSIIDSSSWSLKSVDLTSITSSTSATKVRLGFYHSANASSYGCGGTSTGWYIDDVLITKGVPQFTGDFENGWKGWHGDRGVWQIGAPSTGPGAAFAGDSVAATHLDANHPGNTDSRLISPTTVLPTLLLGEELHLRFQEFFSYSSCDSARVQISVYDDSTASWGAWSSQGQSIVNTSAWSLKDVDLTAFAGDTVRVAFYHTADSSSYGCGGTSTGWYIDEVQIVKGVPQFTGDFENGWMGWFGDRGVWQVGAPSTGPGAAFAGSGVAATHLDGNHPGNTDSRLVSPTTVLPSLLIGEELHLRFQEYFSYSSCDSAQVQISVYDDSTSTWGPWSSQGQSIVNTSLWSLKDVDLTAFAGDTVRLAFFHKADSSSYGCGGTSTGWYLDEVQIVRGVPQFTGSFELGGDDWSADRGVWQIGDPGAGPGQPLTGSYLAATHLDGNHAGNTDSRLISKTTTLPISTGFDEIHLRFNHWFSYSSCDYGQVQVQTYEPSTQTWSGWFNAGSVIQNSSGWSQKDVDLTAYSGQTVRVAFLHVADSSSYGCGGTSLGWYIDDVVLASGFPGLWADLGFSLPGATHDPSLNGTGTLQAGSPATLDLTDAPANANAVLVMGLSAAYYPLKGGFLVPKDDLIYPGYVTSNLGEVSLTTTWVPGIPSGSQVYLQYWVQDGTAPAGYSASNGVLLISP